MPRHLSAVQPQKSCRFCEIIVGTAKAYVVYRDEAAMAFLDYRPLALGHVLLVPVEHYAELADLPDQVIAALAIRIKLLSAAVVRGMEAQGSFIALNNIVSQSVPHVHFHIVPRRKGDGLFAYKMVWKRVSYRDDAQRAEVAERIRAAIPASD
jgi:histidine triad (HIT) family protein